MRFGINTGFAVNRFPLPRQWLKVVGEELDLRYVQLTADIFNPDLGEAICSKWIHEINIEKEKYAVEVDSVMTGAFTRVNHFSHPDPAVQKHWKKWFRDLVDMSVAVGATNLSSHFGIQCYEDYLHPAKRESRLLETVSAWKELAEYAAEKGMEYLTWEPMSIGREYGETLAETERIHHLLEDSAIPILLCLDINHGNALSGNPDDTNYRKWIERFAPISPLIHLKQSTPGKAGNFPFISEYNIGGDVDPNEFLTTLKKSHPHKDTLLLLELSFKEREPVDSQVLEQLKESTTFWKKALIQ